MEDEFPDEFQRLRQDYDVLTYPGDLPGDLGLVPAQPAMRGGWTIGHRQMFRGPMTVRWLGLTAAAAAVALVAGGALHALILSGATTHTVAAAPATPPRVQAPSITSTQASTPTVFASNTNSTDATKKSATADDSIPLWSDVDSPTLSTAAAGLPSESLILPSLSEVQAEKATGDQAKLAQPKS